MRQNTSVTLDESIHDLVWRYMRNSSIPPAHCSRRLLLTRPGVRLPGTIPTMYFHRCLVDVDCSNIPHVYCVGLVDRTSDALTV